MKNKTLIAFTRSKPYSPDPRIFLYGLYKYSEACDGLRQVTLGQLLDFGRESVGVSPVEIFGLTREETEQYLRGLAQNYQNFVSYGATHGLEVLTFNPDKTSEAVLDLFIDANEGAGHAI